MALTPFARNTDRHRFLAIADAIEAAFQPQNKCLDCNFDHSPKTIKTTERFFFPLSSNIQPQVGFPALSIHAKDMSLYNQHSLIYCHDVQLQGSREPFTRCEECNSTERGDREWLSLHIWYTNCVSMILLPQRKRHADTRSSIGRARKRFCRSA